MYLGESLEEKPGVRKQNAVGRVKEWRRDKEITGGAALARSVTAGRSGPRAGEGRSAAGNLCSPYKAMLAEKINKK